MHHCGKLSVKDSNLKHSLLVYSDCRSLKGILGLEKKRV